MELFTQDFYLQTFRTIRALIEEPAGARPQADEPVMEVIIDTVEFSEDAGDLRNCFVRLWMDGELVGETSVLRGGGRHLAWRERLLVLPRGSVVSRFDICAGELQRPLVRGHCVFGTEGLWRSAAGLSRLSIDAPILSAHGDIGVLRLSFRMWDGLPLPQANTLQWQPWSGWPDAPPPTAGLVICGGPPPTAGRTP
mmetsp:Transcript_43895/g.124007  ORF Transcript_43895/g.124007 Transcript_43895/m.124007 type:complete len:196 (-) Transcript_43895:95-682(-)